MKKRVALLLCLLLLLSVFAGCGPKEPGDVQLGEDKMTEYGFKDFNGKTINYLCETNSKSTVDPETGTGSMWNDYIIDHMHKVETDMNLQFNFEAEQGGNMVKKLQAMAMSGTNEADIVLGDGQSLISLYPTGIFADINDLEAIDLSNTDKFGQPSIRAFAEYQGKLYSLYQVGNITWPGAPFNVFNAVLINDTLVEDLSLDHPVEMYEQGTWTFNTFKNYIQSATNADPTNYVYGLDATWFGHAILPQSALYANGCPPVIEDAQGKYTFGYASTAAAHALEWAREIYAMTENVANNADNHSSSSYFASNNATLFLGHSYFLTTEGSDIQQNIEKVSFVTFPYGEDVEYGSISTSFYDTPNATSIVRNGDEQDTAIVLDHILDPMIGTENGEYEDYLKKYFFPDYNSSFDIYTEAGKNASYEYTAQLSNVINDINDALTGITKGERSVTEAITSITNRVNAEIDTQFN